MRKCITLLVCIFCASLTWGQTMTVNYNHSESYAWVDNTPNCTNGHFNCWHLGNYTLSGIYSGGGLTAGKTSSGQVVFLTDYPANSWTLQSSMGTVHDLAIGSSTAVYALLTEGYCSSGYYGIYKWSGTAWVTAGPYSNSCASKIAAAPDKTICILSTIGQPWCNPKGNGWVSYAGTGDIDVSTGGAKLLAVVQSNNRIQMYNFDTSAWEPYSTLGTVKIALDPSSKLYAIGTDATVYIVTDAGASGLAKPGNFTALANGGPMYVWAVGPTQSGANVWRYPGQGLMISTTLSGNTNCTGNGCNTALHTPHAQASWAGHHTGGAMVTGPGVTPTTQINLTASDTLYDPFLCFEDDPACVPSIEQTKVDCTVAGAGFYNPGNQGGLLPYDLEEATTRAKWTGGGGINCAKNPNKLFCDYPVITYCTPESTPPDWTISPPYIWDVCATRDGFGNCLPAVVFGWDAQTICARRQEYRGTGKPWVCSHGLSILQDLDDPNTQPADCTHNY